MNSHPATIRLSARRQTKILTKKLWKDKILYIMFLPVLANFIIFHYLPMYGVKIAFYNYHPAYPMNMAPWVGWQKFEYFFKSYYFWDYTRNTLAISISSIIVGFPLPIIMALLINEIRKPKLKRTFQTVTYMPWFVSSVIVVGIIGMLLNPTDGIVNQIITSLGRQPVNFMGTPGLFIPVYLGMGIWQNTGFGAIVYLAAISGVDAELYEAAVIDGAGRFSRMWHITIKSILPTITILFILRLGGILNLNGMDILLLQNPMNLSASEVIQTFVYKRGIAGVSATGGGASVDYSYAAAVGLMLSVIGFLMVLLSNIIVKKLSDSEMALF